MSPGQVASQAGSGHHTPANQAPTAETRILDAAKQCCERWGLSKVTVDDVAVTAGVSRATLYRLFPGGKDVLFEALRVRELTEFFDLLTAEVDGLDEVDDFEEVVVRLVVTATRALRADDHLAIMLASEPGEALSQLTVDGVPRIIRVATEYLTPFVAPFLDPVDSALLIDILVRTTISYFLAPSEHVDLGDDESARSFLRPGIATLAPVRVVPPLSNLT